MPDKPCETNLPVHVPVILDRRDAEAGLFEDCGWRPVGQITCYGKNEHVQESYTIGRMSQLQEHDCCSFLSTGYGAFIPIRRSKFPSSRHRERSSAACLTGATSCSIVSRGSESMTNCARSQRHHSTCRSRPGKLARNLASRCVVNSLAS